MLATAGLPYDPAKFRGIVYNGHILTVLQTRSAIRSGGHQPAPGVNSIGGDGVLLAFEKLGTFAPSAVQEDTVRWYGSSVAVCLRLSATTDVVGCGETRPDGGSWGLFLRRYGA